jgi:EipB-like
VRVLPIGVLVFLALGANARADEIADQRAMYELTLARTTAASSVKGASGEMGLEVRSTCSGITTNQIFKSDFVGPDSKPRHSELTTSSLEALDGHSFEFTMHNAVEGSVPENFKGNAVKGGAITYESGAFPQAALPQATIFPTEHMKALLAAAEAGKTALSVLVFDGAEKGKVYRAVAVIGAKSVTGTSQKALAGLAHWPVSIGYFPLASTQPTPEYETSFDLYADGVSDRLVIDYGDFALRAELVGLELLPKPKCGQGR